ncbi:acetylcholinesterase-1-like [Dermacentor albipictus]|uniref:acetylcholinesterase-1-like n=1 Tax=Dermacentor albipictus TaxID=60249 RepID=UPI0038FBE92D
MSCFRKGQMVIYTNILFTALVLPSSYATSSVVVSTADGFLRGLSQTVLGKDIQVFLGIPYAKPPVEELRFQKPQPLSPRDGVYDATGAKNSCIQSPYPKIFDIPMKLSEDCLYLNVWTPLASERLKLPVLVWLHGGMFTAGSAYEARYNGSALAALNDVAVVSCNFRLSVFGFLDANHTEAPGNLGLWDQLFVLQWVRRNIHAFGGDPHAVTLFGESSGARMTHAHVLSPHSRDLFHRVFLMSTAMSHDTCVDTVAQSIAKGNVLSKAVGCGSFDLATNTSQALECLRRREAEEICTATQLTFRPTLETEFLPFLPSVASENEYFSTVDAMVSVTANEGPFVFLVLRDDEVVKDDLSTVGGDLLKASVDSLMRTFFKDSFRAVATDYMKAIPADNKTALRQMVAGLMGDCFFNCPTRLFAEKYSAKGRKVYAVVFAHRSRKSQLPEWFGATHLQEVQFVFGIPFLGPANYTDEDREYSVYAMKSLTSFARTGVPVLPDGTEWPEFSLQHGDFIWLQPGNYTMAKNFVATSCDLWRTLL